MSKRACKAKTRAGKACKAAPLKGSDFCRAHDRNRPDHDRFGSPEWSARAGASPKPHRLTLVEALSAKVEEHAEELVGAYIDALRADRGIVVGFGEAASLEILPDYALRLRAADAIYDRLVGKPKQALEHTGPAGGAIQHEVDLRKLSGDELDRLEVLLGKAAADAAEPG